MSFDPRSIERFTFAGWTWNPDRLLLRLRYRLDALGFEETIRFTGGQAPVHPAAEAALERCFDLVHLLAGVSYYKAAVPPLIDYQGESPPPLLASFVERVYRNGLGEFAWCNGLELHDRIHFPCGEEIDDPQPIPLEPGFAVPLGGGKDSLVSVEGLRAAGRPFRLISVGSAPLIAEVAEATGLEHLRIERQLDPRLFELNAQGAWNGHVPISAILAGILVAGALLYGYDHVVMSNEQSADEANVVLDDGFEVNHQYSKSIRFERDLQAVISGGILPGLRYFSLLRPLSELEIARRFAAHRQYHRVFSSCNSNFRLSGPSARRWCRQCPKCRFAFLVLAPFVDRDSLITIFGGNLLDDPDQLAGFRALAGLDELKPFECVGEVEETRSALAHLAEHGAFQDDAVVVALGHDPEVQASPSLEHWLKLRGESMAPPELRGLWDATG